MTRHLRVSFEGFPVPGGWAVRDWCLCGLLVLAAAGTLREATRAAGRKHKDHRGFAAAAGPGWIHHC